MANENNIFEEIFNRLLQLGIKSQTELAAILGISGASVWNAKKENRFPKKWISILCQAYTVTPEWLLGTEPTPIPMLQEQNKDELIQLMKKIIRLEEDAREREAIWGQRLQKSEETIQSLQRENSALRERGDEHVASQKNGENYTDKEEEVLQKTGS